MRESSSVSCAYNSEKVSRAKAVNPSAVSSRKRTRVSRTFPGDGAITNPYCGPMFHEERSRPVHGLQVSLSHRLDRDTAHGGPTHRFTDRFSIAPIILVGL